MKSVVKLFFAFCVALIAMAPTAVERTFIKFDGVDGESTQQDHKGWVEASSFSWGVVPAAGFTGPICMAGPGGGPHTLRFSRTGKPSSLGNLFSQHRLIPSLTVEVNGERHLLQGVTLTSFDTKPAGNGNVTESLSLNFTKCETHYNQLSSGGDYKNKIVAPDHKYLKYESPNAILIGLTPRPEAAALIGLLFNGDGHATLTRKAGGGQQDFFADAQRSHKVIPSLTLTLNNGQKWTFTNVTVAGITDGTSHATQAVSLNFSKFTGSPAGFQDIH